MTAAPTNGQIVIVEAHAEPHLMCARELIKEYLALGREFPATLQHELDLLPGDYAPPRGALLVCRMAGQCGGVVGLMPVGDGICEMKRLYVRASFRRHGIGRLLCVTIMDRAREGGYKRMRLDVVPNRSEAITLYRTLGFRVAEPFHAYSFPMVFLERNLLLWSR